MLTSLNHLIEYVSHIKFCCVYFYFNLFFKVDRAQAQQFSTLRFIPNGECALLTENGACDVTIASVKHREFERVVLQCTENQIVVQFSLVYLS